MRSKLSSVEQRPIFCMRQLRIQGEDRRWPLRIPKTESQRHRRMETKQPLPQLRIHQPLQARQTTKQKQHMETKKTAVLHAPINSLSPKKARIFSHPWGAHSITLNIVLDSNDRKGPVVQFGMNAAFACPVQKEAEAAGSNPARSTTLESIFEVRDW